MTRTLIRQQLEAFSAVALEAADGVPAGVFAAAVVRLTLVDICGGTGGILTCCRNQLSSFKRPLPSEEACLRAGRLTFACFSIWLQCEADRAAAAHTCGCVLTGAVAPPIVRCAGF